MTSEAIDTTLSARQMEALTKIDKKKQYVGAKVVGWDTSIQGPLVRDLWGRTFGISRSGRYVTKETQS
jgi:hypothetical protein